MTASGNRQRRSTTRKNVVHRGQRATLNGKPVIADGKGNWVAVTKGTYGNAQYGGAKAGSYKKGEDRPRAQTKDTPRKRGMSNIPPKEAQPGSPSYVKPGSTGGSGSGSGSGSGNRQNVTPTPPTAPKKPTVATPKKPTVTTPAKPAAREPRTWLKENYKPGGPPKKAMTPKKKKLTNKQRKQGGFH